MTNFIWACGRLVDRVAVVTIRARSRENDSHPPQLSRAWELAEIAAIAAVVVVLIVLIDYGLIEVLLLKLGIVEGVFR